MPNKKKNIHSVKKVVSIFKQMQQMIILPVVGILFILAVLNYLQTRKILKESHENKTYLITEEIKNILKVQDIAFSGIEKLLEQKMKLVSKSLDQEYLKESADLKNKDLKQISQQIFEDTTQYDIYIINRKGEIINTTFEKDLGLNISSFGENHRRMLERIFKGEKFVSERFTMESKTKRLRKFTYYLSSDKKHIIEIGSYSEQADSIVGQVSAILKQLSNQHLGVESVNLFIGGDVLFSFNKESNPISKDTKKILETIFKKKENYKINKKNNTYEYFYMERENTNLYKQSVIQIIFDNRYGNSILFNELIKLILFFILAIVLIFFIVHHNAKRLTYPIKKLLAKVQLIKKGIFTERAEIIGNNEIAVFSEHFNLMLDRIKRYYEKLEEKVKERTNKIIQQKTEIENQKNNLSEKSELLSRQKYKLEKAYEKLRKQKQNLTDSIHYAKSIQNAILPSSAMLSHYFPDYFIYYKPKDIVSGDFYWINEKNGLFYAAGIDCTGHGVPGAFISIVGFHQLNNAFYSTETETPADILNLLNVGMTYTLKQKKARSTIRDGMAIGVCAFNRKTGVLQYAGANNTLFILRDSKLIEIKGNISPIGAFMEEEINTYKNHHFQLEKGDIVYLFSDGYSDQFGGIHGRKYMKRKFKNFLSRICNLPMEEQKELLDDEHIRWKGNFQQVDDILVFGIKADFIIKKPRSNPGPI